MMWEMGPFSKINRVNFCQDDLNGVIYIWAIDFINTDKTILRYEFKRQLWSVQNQSDADLPLYEISISDTQCVWVISMTHGVFATKSRMLHFYFFIRSILQFEPIGPHWLTRPYHMDVVRDGHLRTLTMNEDHGVCLLCQKTYLIKYIQFTSDVSFNEIQTLHEIFKNQMSAWNFYNRS